MKSGPRYEVQMRHRLYGWVSAGNWPARTKAEGMTSLADCANGVSGKGDTHDYRLVRLTPTVLATRKATLRFDEKRQRYVPLRPSNTEGASAAQKERP